MSYHREASYKANLIDIQKAEEVRVIGHQCSA